MLRTSAFKLSPPPASLPAQMRPTCIGRAVGSSSRSAVSATFRPEAAMGTDVSRRAFLAASVGSLSLSSATRHTPRPVSCCRASSSNTAALTRRPASLLSLPVGATPLSADAAAKLAARRRSLWAHLLRQSNTIVKLQRPPLVASSPRRVDGGDVSQHDGIGELDGETALAAEKDAYNDSPLETLGARWSKIFFGNVWNAPRNYPQRQGGIYWNKRLGMKKHRYTKRYRMQRIKIAMIANLPSSRKLRINMVPSLKRRTPTGGRAADQKDVDGMTAAIKMVVSDTVDKAVAKGSAAATGGAAGGKKKKPSGVKGYQRRRHVSAYES